MKFGDCSAILLTIVYKSGIIILVPKVQRRVLMEAYRYIPRSEDNVVLFPVEEPARPVFREPRRQTSCAIKDKETLLRIKSKLLATGKYGYRNYAIFLLGINCGLRCGDILTLRVRDIWDFENKRIKPIVLREEKTGKVHDPITFSKTVADGLTDYILSLKDMDKDAPLFPSQKKESKSPYKPNGKLKKKDDTGCLSRNSYYNILREIRNELGIEHLGTHSMRKTFGYDVYQRYEGQLIAGHYSALDVTQRMLNHSSSYSTLQYIGIDDEIMEQVYDGTCL